MIPQNFAIKLLNLKVFFTLINYITIYRAVFLHRFAPLA